MKHIDEILQTFEKVSLSDLESVKLMDRTDSKFCMHIEILPSVLEELRANYAVLEIDGVVVFHYDNTYFDTADNRMFLAHHNGKRNRHKIRVRNYVESELNFLEIKFKNNKGRTIKDRVVKQYFIPEFTDDEAVFLQENCPYKGENLEPKIHSFFKRFTLVNKDFTERVTIDVALGFRNDDKQLVLEKLAVVEIKQSKMANTAKIVKVLQRRKIQSHGFSKYCVGRSLLEDDIKKNNFKPLMLKLRKYYLN